MLIQAADSTVLSNALEAGLTKCFCKRSALAFSQAAELGVPPLTSNVPARKQTTPLLRSLQLIGFPDPLSHSLHPYHSLSVMERRHKPWLESRPSSLLSGKLPSKSTALRGTVGARRRGEQLLNSKWQGHGNTKSLLNYIVNTP